MASRDDATISLKRYQEQRDRELQEWRPFADEQYTRLERGEWYAVADEYCHHGLNIEFAEGGTKLMVFICSDEEVIDIGASVQDAVKRLMERVLTNNPGRYGC